MDKNYKYTIGGDPFAFIVIGVFLLIFGGVTLWAYNAGNGVFIFTGALSAFVLAILVYCLYSFFFKKIQVDENGFFYRNGFSAGRYYRFDEIDEAWQSEGKTFNGAMVYYLNFRAGGETIRFGITPAHSDAVDYLLEKTGNAEAEDEQ